LKLDSLKIPPTKMPTTTTKSLSGLGAIANSAAGANKPSLTPNANGAVSGEQRRKSQRVLLRVKANIHVAQQGKQSTLEATTLSVYSQGAMIVMKQGLPAETRVVLENIVTKERVGCRVARGTREMPEGFHVPVEFDTAAPTFWGIAFPPADWKPHDDM
jgi:hypothetical protein